MKMQVATDGSVAGNTVVVGREEAGKAQTPESRNEATSAPDEVVSAVLRCALPLT